MDNSFTLTGLILTSKNVGDYDKWVTILTRERGRVGAFVRGARRPKSQVIAAGSAMVYGAFTAYEGRDSVSITGCDISEHFSQIKNDIDLVWYASYFLEVADYYAREGLDESERLRLLYRSLLALGEESFTPEHVKMVYEYRTMVINGEAPNVFECMNCGNKELTHFSMNHRGTICSECAKELGGEVLTPAVLFAMQHMSTAAIEKLYSFVLKEGAFEELKSIILRYRHRYMDHTFNSERFLDN
ncbi:MAG: DNA repair protein RecO [Lachnospiraceae bacterium]|nr:DNA repair protein RecO [Lachnospiraceae bacterium]